MTDERADTGPKTAPSESIEPDKDRFQGRQAELDKIQAALGKTNASGRETVLFYGVGGVGKTHIAEMLADYEIGRAHV